MWDRVRPLTYQWAEAILPLLPASYAEISNKLQLPWKQALLRVNALVHFGRCHVIAPGVFAPGDGTVAIPWEKWKEPSFL